MPPALSIFRLSTSDRELIVPPRSGLLVCLLDFLPRCTLASAAFSIFKRYLLLGSNFRQSLFRFFGLSGLKMFGSFPPFNPQTVKFILWCPSYSGRVRDSPRAHPVFFPISGSSYPRSLLPPNPSPSAPGLTQRKDTIHVVAMCRSRRCDLGMLFFFGQVTEVQSVP